MVKRNYSGAQITVCTKCETNLYLQICHDEAGYYVGFFCPNCGPYGRESEYTNSYIEAELILSDMWREEYEDMRYREEIDRKYRSYDR